MECGPYNCVNIQFVKRETFLEREGEHERERESKGERERERARKKEKFF